MNKTEWISEQMKNFKADVAKAAQNNAMTDLSAGEVGLLSMFITYCLGVEQDEVTKRQSQPRTGLYLWQCNCQSNRVRQWIASRCEVCNTVRPNRPCSWCDEIEGMK